jgi:hypothetical protein
MKQHKGKIIAAFLILCVLAAAYLWGGNYAGKDTPYQAETPSGTVMTENSPSSELPELPELLEVEGAKSLAEAPGDLGARGEAAETGTDKNTPMPNAAVKPAETENPETSAPSQDDQWKDSSKGVSDGSVSYSEEQGMILDAETNKDKYLTDPVPEGKPVPVEPQDMTPGEAAYAATLSVRCDTILDNMKHLDKEKVELVPEDGVIFPATKVTFYEGESVFNVLQREMKKAKIHMEFRNTPIYNSAYIMGINNLYEFDVGELSGWMYKVNDWFPNYGVSRYQLKEGDVVEFVYTCNLGRDVGGHYATRGEE